MKRYDEAHLLDMAVLRKLRLLFERFPKKHNLVLFGQRDLLYYLSMNINEDIKSRITYSGISQQTLAHYEVGRLRVAVIMLPALAKALAVSVEELVDEPTTATKSKRGPASTLQRQIEQVGLMPRIKQKFITEMLDALIKQQQSAQG